MAKSYKKGSIAKYERFVNDVLKDDLRKLDDHLQKTNAEITDLVQQKHTLKMVTDKTIHSTGFKTQLNIGANFFMEAAVPDTSKVLMNIGLNYHLEYSLHEANMYLDARIKAFEKKAEEFRQKTAETKAHIKFMLIGISELYQHENET